MNMNDLFKQRAIENLTEVCADLTKRIMLINENKEAIVQKPAYFKVPVNLINPHSTLKSRALKNTPNRIHQDTGDLFRYKLEISPEDYKDLSKTALDKMTKWITKKKSYYENPEVSVTFVLDKRITNNIQYTYLEARVTGTWTEEELAKRQNQVIDILSERLIKANDELEKLY